MAVPLIDRRICAYAIEITLTVTVEKPNALRPLDDEIERLVIMRAIAFLELDECGSVAIDVLNCRIAVPSALRAFPLSS